MNINGGKYTEGSRLPHGAMAGVSAEVRKAYYDYGYRKDSDMPELPDGPYVVEGTATAEDALHTKDRAALVRKLLALQTPRGEYVLRLRYGIGVHGDYTQEEIGRRIDVTSTRVSQIEAKSLRRMARHYQAMLITGKVRDASY